MTRDELAELGVQFTDGIWNRREYALANEIFAPAFTDHDRLPGQEPGIEGYIEMVQRFHAAYPDLEVRNDDLFVDAERRTIMLRWSADGTHDGTLMGIAPTGKRVRLKGMDILRAEEGKIAERWGEFDALGMFQQIGEAP